MGLTGIVVTQGKEWRVYLGNGHNGTQMISYPTEADVREAALDYVKEQLANGNTLATLLLETINFEAGKVIILSAVPLDSTQLLEFDWGHVPQKPEDATHVTIRGQSFVAYPKAGVEEQLAQMIERWLTGREYVCLLENELARAGDPCLEHPNSSIVLHGVEVYHLVTGANATATAILEGLRDAKTLPVFIGAIGPQPANPLCSGVGHDSVSMEQLRQFAMGVNCMFGQAYDGEGYVVWTAS